MTKLERLNAGHHAARYFYRGWVITKDVRDWDARGLGGNGWAGPKITWAAHPHGRPHEWDGPFRTRAAAIAFVDKREDER